MKETSKKQFKCHICDKNLASKASLNNHLVKIHEGKKNQGKCEVLIDNVEEGKKALSCTNCEQRFVSKSALKKHTQTLHEGRKCTICGIGFINLTAHNDCFKKFSFPCKFCPKYFETEVIRNDHELTHDMTVCDFCFRSIDNKDFDRHLIACQEDLVLKKYREEHENTGKQFMKEEKISTHLPNPQPSTSNTTHIPHPQPSTSNRTHIQHPQPSTSNTTHIQHPQPSPSNALSCNKCEKKFKSKVSVKNHIERVHEAKPKIDLLHSEPSGYPVLPSAQELPYFYNSQLCGIINDIRRPFHESIKFMDFDYPEIAQNNKRNTELLKQKIESYEKQIIQQNQPQQISVKCDKCDLQMAKETEFLETAQKFTNRTDFTIQYLCTHKHNVHEENLNELGDVNSVQVENEEQSVHEGNKPYICEICDVYFTVKVNLTEHILSVHGGDKPIECEICNASFAEKSELKGHISTVHGGKKPFNCDKCSFIFATKSDLKKHISNVHERKKSFQCKFCDASYDRPNDIMVHFDSHHKEIKVEVHERKEPKRKKEVGLLRKLHEQSYLRAKQAAAMAQKLSIVAETVHEGEKQEFENVNTEKEKETLQQPATSDSATENDVNVNEKCRKKKSYDCLSCGKTICKDTKSHSFLSLLAEKQGANEIFVIETKFMVKVENTATKRPAEETTKKPSSKRKKEVGLLRKLHEQSYRRAVQAAAMAQKLSIVPETVHEGEKQENENTEEEKETLPQAATIDTATENVVNVHEKEKTRQLKKSKSEKKKSYDCRRCGKKFNKLYNLNQHVSAVHENNKPFKCELCDMSYKAKAVLMKHHQSIHVEQKDFRKKESYDCIHCEKKFNKSYNHKQHVLAVHEEKKPFKCELCDAAFKAKAALNNHQRSFHSKAKPFTCKHCKEAFIRKDRWQKHEMKCSEFNPLE